MSFWKKPKNQSKLGKLWNKISKKPKYKKYKTSPNAQALLKNSPFSYKNQNGTGPVDFEYNAVYVPQIRNHRPLIQAVKKAGNAYQKNKTVQTRNNLLEKIDALIKIVDETNKRKLMDHKKSTEDDFKTHRYRFHRQEADLQKEIDEWFDMYMGREGKKPTRNIKKTTKRGKTDMKHANEAMKKMSKELKDKLKELNLSQLNIKKLNKTDFYAKAPSPRHR